jgi:hypothetical protein
VKGICEYLAYQDLFEETFKVIVDEKSLPTFPVARIPDELLVMIHLTLFYILRLRILKKRKSDKGH